MCFRYEKQRSNFASCLERAESASKPDSQHLSADKVKLHTEIHDMQVCCLQSHASFFCSFMGLCKVPNCDKWTTLSQTKQDNNGCLSLQALHSEVQSLEPTLPALSSLVTSLCQTAPEDTVKHLKEELENLQTRLDVQNKIIPQR